MLLTRTILKIIKLGFLVLFFYATGNTGADRVTAQKESARRATAAERAGNDHPRRSVRAEFGQERGDTPGRRGKRTAASQPAVISSQSAHEGWRTKRYFVIICSSMFSRRNARFDREPPQFPGHTRRDTDTDHVHSNNCFSPSCILLFPRCRVDVYGRRDRLGRVLHLNCFSLSIRVYSFCHTTWVRLHHDHPGHKSIPRNSNCYYSDLSADVYLVYFILFGYLSLPTLYKTSNFLLDFNSLLNENDRFYYDLIGKPQFQVFKSGLYL